MNQHLGATYGLSLAIVVFFAIALYRPDAPSGKPEAPAALETSAPSLAKPSPPAESPPLPVPTAVAPPPPASPVRAGTTEAAPSSTSQVYTSPPPRVEVRSRPVSLRRDSARRPPPGPFATVGPAETLEDVARRVYGTAEAVGELWRANRDRLPSVDSMPKAGMVLRTP